MTEKRSEREKTILRAWHRDQRTGHTEILLRGRRGVLVGAATGDMACPTLLAQWLSADKADSYF